MKQKNDIPKTLRGRVNQSRRDDCSSMRVLRGTEKHPIATEVPLRTRTIEELKALCRCSGERVLIDVNGEEERLILNTLWDELGFANAVAVGHINPFMQAANVGRIALYLGDVPSFDDELMQSFTIAEICDSMRLWVRESMHDHGRDCHLKAVGNSRQKENACLKADVRMAEFQKVRSINPMWTDDAVAGDAAKNLAKRFPKVRGYSKRSILNDVAKKK